MREPRSGGPDSGAAGRATPIMSSIGAKLALSVVGVLALASVLLFQELTRRERQSLLASKQMAASMVADLFASSLAAPLDFADADAIKTELDNLSENPEVVCVAIWGGDGALAARLDRGCDATALLDASDLASPRIRENRVEVAREVKGRKDKPVGRARVVLSLARENAAYEASRSRTLGSAVAIAIATAALILAIARRQVVRPLARLAEAAVSVGGGATGTQVEVTSSDEIGRLARTFNAMSAAIKDREQRLAAVTQSLRELFDHMGQAILAFDSKGRVRGEVSRQAKELFGADLEGRSVDELLYEGASHQVEAQVFTEFRETAFDVPKESWGDLVDLAPREVALVQSGGSPLPLEVEFQPIVRDGRIERVMLLATDVSEKRRLEQAAALQEEEHEKRMAAMRRLFAGGAQLFVTFTETAREWIEESLATLGDEPRELRRLELEAIFRRVHTLRAEARAFDLRDLEEELGNVEVRLAALRAASASSVSGELLAEDHPELVGGLSRAAEAIDRGREDFVAASPVGAAALEQVTVQRSDLAALYALVGGRGDAVSHVAARLSARPFGESTATLFDMVSAWAEREGKEVHLDVAGRDVRVPANVNRILGGALTHLVRNAIAHGIESAEAREDAGKERVGLVHLGATAGERGPEIVVEDDGAGLDLERIAERARALGIAGKSPEDLVFAPGLSTREEADEIAGRGVGLDAVRVDLASVGYSVVVESERGRFTRFVLRPS